jgi:hypothetical protein
MLLCLLVLTRAAGAQSVIAPLPERSVTPAALPGLQPEGEASNIPEETPLLQWGPVALHPHLLYRLVYGSGIQTAPGHPAKSVIHEVSPGLLCAVGSHWTNDYTPTWTFYSNHRLRDTLDHAEKLTGANAYEDWAFGLSQSYLSSSAPLVETGRQTAQESYSTDINATHQFSTEMSLELAASQNLRFTDKFANTREWSTMNWLNYQFWPRLGAAIGAGVGYVDVDVGTDQNFEQCQGRVNWLATDKISFQVHGGVEDRHFIGANTSDLINPILGGAIQYQPFETTTLILNADHVVTTSFFTNQVAESTSVTATLDQRLLERLTLSVGGGYHIVRYVASANGAAGGRQDDHYTLGIRLSTTFLQRGTIAALYHLSNNSSNRAGFGYSSNQFALEIGYRY